MSRKREAQRHEKKVLAAQLGVRPDEVPDTLRANPRASEPEVQPSLEVLGVRRGLFVRPGPIALHLALFVVDKTGARCVRHGLWACAPQPGPVALALLTAPDDETIRYQRPGVFVLVALLTEGANDTERAAHSAAVARSDLGVVIGDALHSLLDPALLQQTEPAAAALVVAGAPVSAAREVAAAVVALPAAHREKTTLELELHAATGKLGARLRVTLRV
jgi:hypothetical protein